MTETHTLDAATRRPAEIDAADLPIYDSARRPPAALEELGELWCYRDLVIQLVRRDIVARYKRSVLGVAWTMLNPLGTMIVLTIAFSQVFGATRAYPTYVLSGLIAWNFFSQTTLAAMQQLVWGGSLIQRIRIPKTLFAISAVGTGLVNLLLSLVPLTVMLLVVGPRPQPSILLLPVAILLLTAFTLGLGLLLSTLAVYFADVAEMYSIFLLAWMYLTPVIYPEEIIHPALGRWLHGLNPMYHLLKLFRDALYFSRWPSLVDLALTAGIALVVLIVGWIVFTRKADEFAYRT